MKYLKLFEELKSQTYNRAASKLKKMGHERRSGEIYDWSKVVKIKEDYEKWSKLGTFRISFYETSWNESTKSNYKFLFDGQFHVGLDVDIDFLGEKLYDILDGGNVAFFLMFSYGVYPANEETAKKMMEYDQIKENSWGGSYWSENLSIKLSESGFEILPKAESYYDEYENLTYIMSNRKEAIKFHRLLVSLFEQKIDLPVNFGTVAKAKEVIEEKTGNMEIWNRIVNSVKNMPINYLYTD